MERFKTPPAGSNDGALGQSDVDPEKKAQRLARFGTVEESADKPQSKKKRVMEMSLDELAKSKKLKLGGPRPNKSGG